MSSDKFGKIAFGLSLAAGLSLTQPAVATDAQVFTKYNISISGIPIGAARVTTRFDNSSYNVVANGRTAGVSKLVSDGKGTLTTSGRIRSGKVSPRNFAMDTSDKNLVTKVRMALTSSQNINRLVAHPPLLRHPDRIPVERRHHRKVFDPLSAFMIPLDSDGRIEPSKACSRTIPVFDGWQRFDVKLSFKEQKTVNLGGRNGYKGPVVVCRMRYVPVAGHRPTRKATVFLKNNKKMELWLAPVEGVPVLVPMHMRIGTLVGPLTMSTDIFEAKVTSNKRASAE